MAHQAVGKLTSFITVLAGELDYSIAVISLWIWICGMIDLNIDSQMRLRTQLFP
ncbi:Hypothetical protein FKW44_021830 [Caligus rogercresseyi]|uniref:Uncharacterized protein n=1 Tax=Caligus rogercresseyi TaxID=217165 RepID=A0A7T8GS02_CALRO|nr:Hypothetical protein FKW44_021830 [Caligus rogercresseyi]